MPTKATLSLKGLDKYLEAMSQVGKDVDQAAARAVEAGGEVALAGMQSRVPKDTHNLLESLDLKTGRDGNTHWAEIGLLKGTDANTARYGNAQEFGTSRMAAQPYVRPTMDEDKNKIRKAMRDQLQEDGVI
jgi:HK97 gp10 family phage protein